MDTGSRKFAAIVVAILLVLGGLVGALFWTQMNDDEDIDDEEGEGWSAIGDWSYHVDGDARWTDWNLTLHGSIEVETGGSLLLEDCRIEVPIEDLAFSYNSAIYVQWGGSLELMRSELVITADPELDGAWLCTSDYYSDLIPHMWRVVNLEGATAPVLEFDLELWSEDCRIAVAVQVAPDAEMELIGVFGTDDVGWRRWSHVEVPLDSYIDTIPRVVVFVNSPGAKILLLSDLRINDGDGPLPEDLFMTGDPQEDGWSIEDFRSFADFLRDRYEEAITTLITSEGDVRVIDSRIGSPTGLGQISGEYKPQLSTVEEDVWTAQAYAASLGDIVILDSSLTILDSDVSFVPFFVTDCNVEIGGTEFVGNNAMVTLSGCEGSISGSSFTSSRGMELPSLMFSDDIMWQVAIEGVDSPQDFVIEDCTFSGHGMEGGDGYGLHLNDADIRPRGCIFDGLEVAFWNHEGNPGLGWNSVADLNTFGDDCAYWYIDTRETRLEFDGPGRPSQWEAYGYWESISYEDGPRVPFDVYIYRGEIFDIIFAPVVMTGPDLGVVPVVNVTVRVDTDWTYSRLVSFDPHDEVTGFWLTDQNGPSDPMWAIFRLAHERGYNAGRVHQEISIFLYGFYHQDPTVDLYRDGMFIRRLDVEIDVWPDGIQETFVNYSHDMDIPVGVHNVTLSLIAFYTHTQSRISLGDYNITFLRIDQSVDDLDTTSLAKANHAVILLDPWVEQDGVDLMFATAMMYNYRLDIIMWNGSRIVLETIDVRRYSGLEIYSKGPGEVVIGEVSSSYLFHEASNTSVVYQGPMEGSLSLVIMTSDVVMNARLRGRSFWVLLMDGSDLTMEGSVMEFTDEVEIEAKGSNATIGGCTFSATEGSLPVLLTAKENASIRMLDCTFRGASLYASPRDVNCTLDVKDCTFKDPGSYLMLLNYKGPGYWDVRYIPPIIPREGEISGNIFDGLDTGLVFNIDHIDVFLGPNSFNDGAQALALFTTQVTFEDETYGCYTYVINMTGAEGFVELDLFDSSYWWGWFRFWVDMTDDPLNGEAPYAVPIVVKLLEGWPRENRVVIAFDHIQVGVDQVTVRVPVWPYIYADLERLVPMLDDPGNWWTDP